MADNDPVLFDLRSAKIIEMVTKIVRGQVRNMLNRELVGGRQRMVESAWIPYINDSGETIPGNALMAVSTMYYSTTTDNAYPVCTKPSTVFRRLYAINGNRSSTAGSGECVCKLTGYAKVLVDPSTTIPTSTQTIGPVPGQWYGRVGWPATCEVLGSVETSTVGMSVFATLHTIDNVIGKTVTAISSGTVTGTTTTWKIMAGAAGSTLDSGYSTLPASISRVTSISSGLYVKVTFANNEAPMEQLECNP